MPTKGKKSKAQAKSDKWYKEYGQAVEKANRKDRRTRTAASRTPTKKKGK